MRVLIDLPNDDIDWLDRKAAEVGKSRAALVREVIATYRTEAGRRGIERHFGSWKARKGQLDGLEFQRRAREDWNRG